MLRIIVPAFMLLLTCPVLCAQERTWEDSTGKHKVLGSLVEVTAKDVLLRIDGDEKRIPLDKLSESDQAYAKAERKLQAKAKSAARAEARAKLKADTQAAAKAKAAAEAMALEPTINRDVVFGEAITAVWPAKVIGISDGDTIDVLNESNEQIRIRLNGIDTPEKKQAFGQKAKDALGAILQGREVMILETGKDRYKRTLAFIEVLPTKRLAGAIANAEMVRQGFAWHYKTYNGSIELDQLETEAREAKRGLWSDSQTPVAPWEWRKQEKAKQK